MKLSILISHKVILTALTPSITTDFAVVSRKAIELSADLFDTYNCEIYWTSQTKDSVKSKLTYEQFNRAEAVFKEETKTRGVSGYNPDNSTSESALNISYSSPVIVIINEEEKKGIHRNKRIIALTPSELITLHEKVQGIYNKSPFKEEGVEFIDLLLVIFSQPTAISQLCKE